LTKESGENTRYTVAQTVAKTAFYSHCFLLKTFFNARGGIDETR